MAVERLAIDSALLENASFGERKFAVSGNLFWFALRDLVRIRSIELLETRIVDDRRVVFTVRTTEKSYHEDKHIHIERQVLAIRRSSRWYVFRPYGILQSVLRGNWSFDEDIEQIPVLQVNRPAVDEKDPEVDYQLEYLIPIEVIHEHLAEAAKAPEFVEYGRAAQELNRRFRSVVARAKRGDFKERADLRSALDPLEPMINNLADAPTILGPGLQKLANDHLPKPKVKEARP